MIIFFGYDIYQSNFKFRRVISSIITQVPRNYYFSGDPVRHLVHMDHEWKYSEQHVSPPISSRKVQVKIRVPYVKIEYFRLNFEKKILWELCGFMSSILQKYALYCDL